MEASGADRELPALSTLSQRADREQSLGLHEVEIDYRLRRTASPRIDVEIQAHLVTARKVEDSRFLIVGCVDDHQGLSRPLRKAFKLDDGGKYASSAGSTRTRSSTRPSSRSQESKQTF